MQTEKTTTFTMCSIPNDIKSWLRKRASSNNRSMSAEVLTMLEKLKRGELKEV